MPDGGADGSVRAEGPSRPWAARLVRHGPWGALAQRWVPEPLREARVDPGRRGAALLSVVAALAAVIAAVGVWWGRPEPRPVTPVGLASVAQSAPATARTQPRRAASSTGADAATDGAAVTGLSVAGRPPATSARSDRAGPMLVSVTGKVRHPGLVTVPPGARVADAISAAGGALHAADLTGLNLAARLSDGDSVVVAGPSGSSADLSAAVASDAQGGASPGGTGTAASGSVININTADAATLEQLPGVGPVTAAAIVAWRTEHGPFTSVTQLQAVSGIGPAKYAQISPHATV